MSTAAVLAASALGGAVPTPADTSSAAPTADQSEVVDSDDDGLLDAATTAAAAAGAKAEGEKVEDLSQRTESVSVYANPDGTFTRRDFGATVRVKKSGKWVPVDYTLVEQPDGSFAPKASDLDITIGGEDAREAARVQVDDDESLAFTWPTDLPKPVVDGGVATYKLSEATDLVVAVGASGVTTRIRLNEKPAADDPALTLGLRADSLDLKQKASTDALTISDDGDKTVGGAQQFLAWDSSTDRVGDPTNVVELDATLEQTRTNGDVTDHALELTAPDGYLTDSDTEYPVTIDPNIRVGRVRDTWVRSGQANAYGDDHRLIVGKVDPDTSSNTNPARAFLKFFDSRVDTNPNVKVTGATLSLWQYYGYSCTDRRMLAYPVGAPWSDNLTWASGLPAMKWTNGTYVDDNRGASGCGQGWTKLNITSMAQAWNTGAIDNNGLRLQADDETVSAFERRFCSMDPVSSESICNTATRSPTLDVTYNTPPGTASSVAVIDAADGKAIQARVTDPDGGTLRADVDIYAGSTVVARGSGSTVASGGLSVFPLPDLPAGSYSVNVTAHDGVHASANAATTTFEVDEGEGVFSRGQGQILFSGSLAPGQTKPIDPLVAVPALDAPEVASVAVRMEATSASAAKDVSLTHAESAEPSTITLPLARAAGAQTRTPVTTGVMHNSDHSQYMLTNTSATTATVAITVFGWEKVALELSPEDSAPQASAYTPVPAGIGSSQDSHELRFPIDLAEGEVLRLGDAGRPVVEDGDGVIMGHFKDAWAVDSAGVTQASNFAVDGGTLIQTVTPSTNVTYPILVSPFFIEGENAAENEADALAVREATEGPLATPISEAVAAYEATGTASTKEIRAADSENLLAQRLGNEVLLIASGTNTEGQSRKTFAIMAYEESVGWYPRDVWDRPTVSGPETASLDALNGRTIFAWDDATRPTAHTMLPGSTPVTNSSSSDTGWSFIKPVNLEDENE